MGYRHLLMMQRKKVKYSNIQPMFFVVVVFRFFTCSIIIGNPSNPNPPSNKM